MGGKAGGRWQECGPQDEPTECPHPLAAQGSCKQTARDRLRPAWRTPYVTGLFEGSAAYIREAAPSGQGEALKGPVSQGRPLQSTGAEAPGEAWQCWQSPDWLLSAHFAAAALVLL